MRRALGALASGAWRLQRTGADASTAALQLGHWGPALATQAGVEPPPGSRAPFGHSDVLHQPTVRAALRLLDSLPPGHAQYPGLLAAALRRTQWVAPDCGDASERAAAAELVRRGWQSLSAMDGNDLTDLLRAATALEPMAGKQLRAWQAAYEAWLARGGVRLSCNSRLDILQAAVQLSRTSGLRLPGPLLGRSLGYLCRPPSLAKLSLRQLVALCWHARELGFYLTVEQHVAVAAAAQQKAGQEFSALAISSLLRCWADMEQEHITWLGAGGLQQEQQPRQPRHVLAGSQHTPSVGAAAPTPISGYPGDEVMAALMAGVHAHRSDFGSWALGQTLYALGMLRYLPPREQLEDLVAALAPQVQGAEQQRGVSAALSGLGLLGFDPGEGFVAACMRVVEADGGRNQMLVSNAAWALAVLQRCPPERWQALVALLHRGLSADLSSAEWQPGLLQWLTAYQLVRQQHGAGVAPLPADLLQRGVESAGARSTRRRHAKRGLLQAVAAEVVRVMVGSRYAVEQAFWLVDPATNKPLVVDVAVPALKFGVQLSRTYEVARNTGAPLGMASILPRLARLAGWEVAVLPQEVLAVGKEQRDAQALQRALHAFLLEHTRLPQLLLERAGAGGVVGAAS